MFSRFFAASSSSEEDSQSYSEDSYDSGPRSMEDYYNALAYVIASIREEVPGADSDPGFFQAATVLTKIINMCRDIEYSLNPVTAMHTNSQRSKLIKTIGPDGMIEITGEASRLLAEDYRDLMIAVANKEYMPNPPMLYSSIVLPRYESELAKRAKQTQERIEEYTKRIAAYDAAQNRPGLG